MNGLITRNEASEDGRHVHLYFIPQASVWVAYGQSAYALRLYVKKHTYDSLRGFSEEMQEPCTIVSEYTIKRIRSAEPIVSEREGEYLELMLDRAFDFNDYIRWIDKLREEVARPDPIVVSTRVSSQVPKGVFIEDNMSSFTRNVKRLGDFLMSGVALLIFSPLFLVCYLAVRREDGGPAIFKQERIGRFGKPFNIYKFRSMRLDAEQFGPQLSHSGGDDDPRLTKVGRFLRAHHLDELPQLWNVFKGDMAFIGPRPERKFYIDQILEYDKRYSYLYQIRPGVTSYATLYNGYTDTMEKMLQRLEYDLYYLGHRSWWFDAKILVNTFLSIVFGKKF